MTYLGLESHTINNLVSIYWSKNCEFCDMYIHQSKEPFTLLQKWQVNWCEEVKQKTTQKHTPPKNCKIKFDFFTIITIRHHDQTTKYQETRFCDTLKKLRHFFAERSRLPIIVQEN